MYTHVVAARRALFYLSHKNGYNCAEIGRRFKRDRSTVLNAVQHVRKHMLMDRGVPARLLQAEALIETMKLRTCLAPECGNTFLSEGPGDRLCSDRCRKRIRDRGYAFA